MEKKSIWSKFWCFCACCLSASTCVISVVWLFCCCCCCCQASSLLVSALVMLVPLVDCSTAVGSVEMSEQETELCTLSAQFEEFVVHFLDRWVDGDVTFVTYSNIYLTARGPGGFFSHVQYSLILGNRLGNIFCWMHTFTCTGYWEVFLFRVLFCPLHFYHSFVTSSINAVNVSKFFFDRITISTCTNIKLYPSLNMECCLMSMLVSTCIYHEYHVLLYRLVKFVKIYVNIYY